VGSPGPRQHLRRIKVALASGCDSVDGTHIKWNPRRNLPQLIRWLAEINGQQVMRFTE
jgi:hypothetical protein